MLQLVFGWHAMLGGGEPAVHWTARYVDASGSHTIEVWRQPDHVRRLTDGVLELDAVRPRGDGYRFSINDRASGTTFHGREHDRIAQGSFDDWQRWTRVIAPSQPGALVWPLDRPALTTAAGRCHWLRDAATEICWSTRLALPLVLRVAGSDVYTVRTAEPLRTRVPPFTPAGHEVVVDDD
ncbi:MAG: hypothetical protein ABIY55_27295 [Kofleriaceae bacterium]